MKKIILVFGIFIFLVILFGTLFLGTHKNTSSPFNPFQPTPTLIIPANQQNIPLLLLSTTPTDYSTQLPPTQSLVFTFNKPISSPQLGYSILPPITLVQQTQGAIFTLTPTQTYETNILYTLILFDSSSGKTITTLHFSSGTSPTATPMLDSPRMPNIDQEAQNFNKANYPDVFLSNDVPYSTKDFSVSSNFVIGSPYGHYAFTVTQNDTAAKQGFLNWLKSLGLTDAQIQSLDITYQ